MRVLAIGLGGSGSRIVDSLYDHDQKSGVGCMQPIAIDTDANTLMALRHIPVSARLHFAPLDLAQSSDVCQTIHSGEIMSYIQGADTVRIDALFLCCGLGGCMGAAVAAIVPELRKSFIEPIFMVVTLPCRMEGEKRSAQAADDLDLMLKIVDGIILFDNETWYRKIKDQLHVQQEKEGVRKDTGPTVFDLLNMQVARRVGLLLRAGEINEKSYEPAEVVLDAGEVLNTLRGMGLVAIGYASEEIPSSFLGFLNRMQLNRYFMESSQKKAARIVALAKKAVYDEISIPCDITSAEKALVLIAGPSHELSMRGFQTVRKWVDRSIAGLEMRSGDYPIRNTKYVGIVIALSGLKNIPRVEELRQIRSHYRTQGENSPPQMQSPPTDPPPPSPPINPDPARPADPEPVASPAIGSNAPDPAQTDAPSTTSAVPDPLSAVTLPAIKPKRKATGEGNNRRKKKMDDSDGLTWFR